MKLKPLTSPKSVRRILLYNDFPVWHDSTVCHLHEGFLALIGSLMNNKIRWFLLLSFIGLLFTLGYMFKTNFKEFSGPLKVKLSQNGIDIEIENFKVTHKVLGQKKWELKASLAQINTKDKITILKNVELILHHGNDQQAVIYADTGTLYEASKEVDLQGNVRLISSPEILKAGYR